MGYYSDPAVGGDGQTYTSDRDPVTGLGNYGYVRLLTPMFQSIVNIANWVKARADEAAAYAASALNAPGTLATSTTPLTIGTGTQSLTIQTGKFFGKNQTVLLSGTAGNWMLGLITSYNSVSGALVVNVQTVGGSGNLSAWEVSLAAASGSGVAATRAINTGGIATGGGNLSADRTITVTKAAAADIRAKTEDAKAVTPKSISDATKFVALTDASTIALDLNSGINFSVTLGGNRTLGAPTNATEGQSGRIKITQDGTGSRTLGFAAAYLGSGSIGGAAGAVSYLNYFVEVGGGSPVVRYTVTRF